MKSIRIVLIIATLIFTTSFVHAQNQLDVIIAQGLRLFFEADRLIDGDPDTYASLNGFGDGYVRFELINLNYIKTISINVIDGEDFDAKLYISKQNSGDSGFSLIGDLQVGENVFDVNKFAGQIKLEVSLGGWVDIGELVLIEPENKPYYGLMSIHSSEHINGTSEIINNNRDDYATGYLDNSLLQVVLKTIGVNYLRDASIYISEGENYQGDVYYSKQLNNPDWIHLTSISNGDNLFTIDDYTSLIKIEVQTFSNAYIYLNELSIYDAEYRSIVFDYDDAGNRIRRYFSIQSLKSGAINQQKEETEGTLDWDKLGITLYPNPTHGQLLLEFKNYPENTQLKAGLYNISGQQLLLEDLQSNPSEIDIRNFPAGTYILKIWVDNEYKIYQVVKN